MILDGGTGKGDGINFDGGFTEATANIISAIEPKRIFIEGFRKSQAWQARKVLSHQNYIYYVKNIYHNAQIIPFKMPLTIICKLNYYFWEVYLRFRYKNQKRTKRLTELYKDHD